MASAKASTASTWASVVAVAGGAACFILGAPGGPLPWLGWLAPVGVVALGRRSSLLWRLVGSAVLAGSATGPIVAGLAFRAPWHGLALALCPSAWLAAAILISVQARELSASSRILLFASVWCGGSSVLELLGAPFQGWCLSAALAIEHPTLWPIIELGGWPLLDALLFGCVAVVVAFFGKPPSSSRLYLLGGTLVAIVLVAFSGDPPHRSAGRIRVGVIQPNTAWATLRNTGGAPADRSRVKRTILGLTDQALSSGAELVVWPENGMGLPLGQLPAELAGLRRRLIGSSAQILATGDEVHPAGALPTAWLVSDAGVFVVHKRENIPLLEDAVSTTGATVLAMTDGSVGVLICYDVIRYRSFRDTVRDGAELVVSPTDNSSYDSSTLTHFQLAFGALLAIEHGRSLVFVANRGPSTLVDPVGGRIETLVPVGREGVATVDVEPATHPTAAARGGRVVTTMVLMGCSLLLLLFGQRHRRRSTQGTTPLRSRLRAVDGVSSAIAWAAATWISAEASMRLATASTSTADVARHHVAAARVRRVFDPGSKVFRQSDEDACGPAALAWVAFSLGDVALEREFRRHGGRHSLADLQRAARERGFRARAFEGEPNGLRPAADALYVLHLDEGHFVGCRPRADRTYAVFDPATGNVSVIGADALASRWSGYGLEVRLPEPLQDTAREPRTDP